MAGCAPPPVVTWSSRNAGVALPMVVWTLKIPSARAGSPAGPHGLPVEVLPELKLDAIDDAGELLAVVLADDPELVNGAKLGDVREAVFGRFRHRHFPGEEPPIAFTRMDPEALGRLLGVEPRRLSRR